MGTASFDAAEAFRFQSTICHLLDAPFCAELLERTAAEVERDGPVFDLVRDWPGDPLRDYLPLRILAGVHHLVLIRALPDLAAHYPTAGGAPQWPEAWDHFLHVLVTRGDDLRAWYTNTPQTNEVGRAGTLAGGFHYIALATGRALALREMGASAGLNLLWDRYRYELGSTTWGDPESSVHLNPRWKGAPPALADTVAILSRRGCDLDPISIWDFASCDRLEAYVWADHPHRLDRLRRALDLARRDPPAVDAEPAGTWLARQLDTRPDDAALVVYHSSFWSYLSETEQRDITALLSAAGAAATPTAPLAWLRLEDAYETPYELWVRLWPGGEDRKLAEGHPHGQRVRWTAPPPAP